MYSSEKYIKDERILQVREAEGKDAKQVLEFLESVSTETDFLSFGVGEFELTEKQEFDYLEKCRNTDNLLYLLGVLDNKIAGILFFSAGSRSRTRHTGELGTSVLNQYWNMGIFSALWDSFLEWCHDGGIIKKINLRVRTDNQRAIKIYKRIGFAIEGTIKKEMFLGGKYYDNYWMGIEL
jgi:RimJ/RimL family protein N-acetyltransferase